jgi:hypothetical protein
MEVVESMLVPVVLEADLVFNDFSGARSQDIDFFVS